MFAQMGRSEMPRHLTHRQKKNRCQAQRRQSQLKRIDAIPLHHPRLALADARGAALSSQILLLCDLLGWPGMMAQHGKGSQVYPNSGTGALECVRLQFLALLVVNGFNTILQFFYVLAEHVHIVTVEL